MPTAVPDLRPKGLCTKDTVAVARVGNTVCQKLSLLGNWLALLNEKHARGVEGSNDEELTFKV